MSAPAARPTWRATSLRWARSATLLSVVGNDEAGACLERLLNEHSNLTALLHRDNSISTIIKLRAIARHQQLLRIDFETPPSHEVLHAALEDFRAQLPLADVVILSDYGKGGLAHIGEMMRLARAAGKPVLVDPKGDDYARYRGATLLTPNRSEFREVAGSWRTKPSLQHKGGKVAHRTATGCAAGHAQRGGHEFVSC